jgi:hypothetical protein
VGDTPTLFEQLEVEQLIRLLGELLDLGAQESRRLRELARASSP